MPEVDAIGHRIQARKREHGEERPVAAEELRIMAQAHDDPHHEQRQYPRAEIVIAFVLTVGEERLGFGNRNLDDADLFVFGELIDNEPVTPTILTDSTNQ